MRISFYPCCLHIRTSPLPLLSPINCPPPFSPVGQGKTNVGNDRALHHYAGALNAIPLLQQYLREPDNTFLLRLGMAGMMGSLTNIQPSGGPSMAFHGDPSLLRPDGYSADWGIGFFGHASQVGRSITPSSYHYFAPSKMPTQRMGLPLSELCPVP